MALTNFSLLQSEQKLVWSRDLWRMVRNRSFLNRFMGSGQDAMIQHITELTKSEKGTSAIITLLADLEGDGVVGDNQLEGYEEAMRSFNQTITVDQMRHAVRREGRMAEQKSVVAFRGTARDQLSYWLADRIDQLAFLTLSGVPYSMANNGKVRVNSYFPNLEFAAKVTAPTSQRRYRWNATTKTLEANGATNTLVATDKVTWQLFVDMKAILKTQHIRPIRGDNGREVYHVFVTPKVMSQLKMDSNYIGNLRSAGARGDGNSLFTGDWVNIDGLVIHEYHHVYNTASAASGAKWGASGTVDGCQILFCGAQALAYADIGAAEWVEETFDYGNSNGISVAKILGFLKPTFNSMYAGNTLQDFGVASVYVAQ